jgi:hypothetical protein
MADPLLLRGRSIKLLLGERQLPATLIAPNVCFRPKADINFAAVDGSDAPPGTTHHGLCLTEAPSRSNDNQRSEGGRRRMKGFPEVLLAVSMCVALTACSAKVAGKDHKMAYSDDWRRYKDPTQRPGAVVIHPKLDPNMIYDPKTKRVTDTRTGDYFSFGQTSGINRFYQGAIFDESGKTHSVYKARYDGPRLPNGEEKSVYEILWTLRGEDSRKMMREQIAGRDRAKNDSLDRLASFLLAQSIGLYGGIKKGDVVLVDRRMDDTEWERYN